MRLSTIPRNLLVALVLGTAAPALVACEGGPFEEAGEEIDDAVDEVEDELD